MPQSSLNSLKGCWRSTAIAARGSISIEADGKCLCCSVVGNALGKCQFVVDSLNNRGQIQNKMLKSLSITLHPTTSYVSLQNETLVLTVWCSSFQLFPPQTFIFYMSMYTECCSLYLFLFNGNYITGFIGFHWFIYFHWALVLEMIV